jgi:DNA-directed RNA polymerase II subunit RPB1
VNTYKYKIQMIGRSSFNSLQFYTLGSLDAKKNSVISVNNKIFNNSDGSPVSGSLISLEMGSTEKSYSCLSCMNTSEICPGHSGHLNLVQPVKSPFYRDEIKKWLKLVCANCHEFVIPFSGLETVPNENILTEFAKKVNSSDDKYKVCYKCKHEHPFITFDPTRKNVIMAEYYTKGNNKNPTLRKILHNHEIKRILNSITDKQVLQVGKNPTLCHPSKLMLDTLVVPPPAIRPNNKHVSGNRSNMSDITNYLKNILDFNSNLPSVITDEVDKTLSQKLMMFELSVYEMIRGHSASSQGLSLVTDNGRVAKSLAARLPTKTGRFRGNLSSKRIGHIGRSVITGDPALKANQLGVPMKMAMSDTISEIVRPWSRARLTRYFENGPDIYPGCSIITTKHGDEKYVSDLPDDYVLQDGDIVHRHIVDGDVVMFNRAPSLWWCSVISLEVKVIPNALTLRLNNIICPLLNADFDGDECNVLFLSKTQAIVEAKIISSIPQWTISYQKSTPMMGLMQDPISGGANMSKANNNIHKYHAMLMCGRCTKYGQLDFRNLPTVFSSRELISMFLPNDVNYKVKPKYYNDTFANMLKYHPEDIKVVIKRGKLISGVIDKASVGDGVSGSLFHKIYDEYGATEALKVTFNLQQLFQAYLHYDNSTFGMGDLVLSSDINEIIGNEIKKNIKNSMQILKDADDGKIIPPLGTPIDLWVNKQYIKSLTHGDEFYYPIVRAVSSNNNLFRMIATGTRGKPTNMKSIFGAKGAIGIEGGSIQPIMDKRTSIYFKRYDTNPISRGYDISNFVKGITPETYFFASLAARSELTQIALGTAIGGHINRTAVKTLENIVTNNTLSAATDDRIVQPLCCNTGFDSRKMMKVKIKFAMLNTVDFKKQYYCDIKHVDKIFRNKKVKSILDSEFANLSDMRLQYREIFQQYERQHIGTFMMSETTRLPVNINTIIENTIINFEDHKRKKLDPVASIKSVDHFCKHIGKVFKNGQEREEYPDYIEHAVLLLRMHIYSALCVRQLQINNIDNDMLELILEKIKLKIKNALLPYGLAIGIIASQSLGQPITQYYLDAKHRSGLQAETINIASAFNEIIKYKPTDKLSNPAMKLTPLDEYKYDRYKVFEISNQIELSTIGNFVSSEFILYESIHAPMYPRFAHESKMIKNFIANTLAFPVPKNLLNWCIRFEFNWSKMVAKGVRMIDIELAIAKSNSDYYTVSSSRPDNNDIVIMRVYIKKTYFAKKDISINAEVMLGVVKIVKDIIVKGIDGIHKASLKEFNHSKVMPDGSVIHDKFWGIVTMGTNLSKILENPYLDVYNCYSTSVEEIEQQYGIFAAKNKITAELTEIVGNVVPEMISVYASEMTYNSVVTNIQRAGLGKRAPAQILQRAVFGTPVQVLQKAGINAKTDNLKGMSSRIVMGNIPKIGTFYNNLSIDHERLRDLQKNVEDTIDDL